MPKIPTNDEFDAKLHTIHGDKYSRVGNRIPNQTNILCLCNVCGNTWNARIRHLLNGFGCPSCRKTSPDEFDRKVLDIFDGKLMRSGEYPCNQNEKVKMKCSVCGLEENKKVSHVLSGHGCKNCAHEKTLDSCRLSKQEFISRCIDIHGNVYEYSMVEYKRISDKVKIICKTHGEYEQTASDHLYNKSGCQKCKESKGEKAIRIFLDKHQIEYKKNKRYSDCRHKNPLPFDFFIPSLNMLIEYDGEQHTNHIRFGFGRIMSDVQKERYLRDIIMRDKIKDEYCKNNSIRLLRISYRDYNNINSILSSYFLFTNS